MIIFISYTVTVSQLNEIGPIHRPKLRSSPKLGKLMELMRLAMDTRLSPSMITLTSDLNTWCDGGVRLVRVPVAFRNKCERNASQARNRNGQFWQV